MGRISLDRLCGGALLERFTLAMAQIGRNIMDPNTNPEKARTLTIKLTFKPSRVYQWKNPCNRIKGCLSALSCNYFLHAYLCHDEKQLLLHYIISPVSGGLETGK